MTKRILYILAISLSILACTDEIDKSNRFTFTGETMADYLLNRSDRYSHFINLLKRAGLFSLLNTYGQYTLFLPDNAAVEKFVAEQDSTADRYAAVGNNKYSKSITILLGLYIHFLFLSVMYLYFIELPLTL